MYSKFFSYKTQTEDTSIEAELVQFNLWRNLSSQQKFFLVKNIYKKGNKFALLGTNYQINSLQGLDFKKLFILKRYNNQEIFNHNFLLKSGDKELMLEEPLWLAEKLANIFESLNIPYSVGGSVASSLQGEVRYTQDLDLVIKLELEQKKYLIEQINQEFYFSEIAIDEAMTSKTLYFNLIHLQTIEKADIFISREDDFAQSKMKQLFITDNNTGKGLYLCYPEDIILQKLVWYKMKKGESQKQWRDLLGVLKLQQENLDFKYLQNGSKNLALTSLLNLAFQQSGIN